MYLPVLILEIIGTVAFSISGALTGVRKNMDIFGVCILGLTTAVGGGIISCLLYTSSREDIETTIRIQEALAGVDVELADHIIVADDDFVSVADSGFLEKRLR